jgi:hypothetical protein
MRRDEAGSKRSGANPGGKSVGAKIEIRNANNPGWSGKVDAAKYEAMKDALLRVIPRGAPGLTQTEMRNKAIFHLPAHVFPNGEKAEFNSTLNIEVTLCARKPHGQCAGIARKSMSFSEVTYSTRASFAARLKPNRGNRFIGVTNRKPNRP